MFNLFIFVTHIHTSPFRTLGFPLILSDGEMTPAWKDPL